MSIWQAAVYALAGIGAFVVAILALILAYLALGLLLSLADRTATKASKLAFDLGGGRTHVHEKDDRTPRPPWDRVWTELLYLKNLIHVVERTLGYRSGGRTASRPDLERLYELREENWGGSE